MKTPEWDILLKNNINDEHIIDLDSRVSVRCALAAMREFKTQQVNNSSVPNIVGQFELVPCDICGKHTGVMVVTDTGRFCLEHVRY